MTLEAANSFITHGPISGQVSGLMSVVTEHLDSTGQTMQGADSMDEMFAGSRRGVSLYVHRPSSRTLTRLIIPRFSSLIASLEPSLLVSPSSFQISLWRTPSLPLSTTSL